MVHINFNLTSLNSLGIVAVIAHFLNKNLKNQSLLIRMRKVKGSYSEKNITEVIIPILVKINIISNLRYFITDNIIINDVIIKLIL
jgi:hypothetical protein